MDPFLIGRMEEINREYFQHGDLPSIRWSKGSVKRKYRKITFGSYDFKKNQIRIHPVLKNSDIPSYVLEYVLFHELLHYQDREELKAGAEFRLFGRKRFKAHSRDFHRREKDYPYKKEATRVMKSIAGGTFGPEERLTPRETLFS